jgi:glycosyltransferase involved in cell wall biosynthesis
VVVPVYNERESIQELIEEIDVACQSTGRPWEVLFVDDGSTDGSTEELKRLAERPDVSLVKLRRNFGKSAALTAGFEQSSGEVVVTIDGDGQDDPAELPRLLEALDSGYDLVCGWKRTREDSAEKRLASRLFNKATARLSGVRLHDFNCGLKAYRGDCARSLALYGEQHRFIPVLAFQRGWRVTEQAVNHRPRRHGSSKFGLERYVRGFLDLLTVLFMGRYQYRPLHLFGSLGLVLMMVGMVICAVLSLQWAGGEAIGRRPLLTLGVLLIVVGVQLLTLGLVGEMITALRQDVRGRRTRAGLVDHDTSLDASRGVPAEDQSDSIGARES